ncbi:exopolysaccharide biosynthesis protein [Stutzerimonas tarimensis]|uniref:Exopolysaccharide biosynthesis protein n=1 Tax=Stutzerimonas tarimensis TaxID=1507735 RepID=A0ABV7T7E6_9GAMM
MSNANDPQRMTDLLKRLETAGDEDRPVTVREMVEAIGQGSFGMLLLVPGLLALSPASGVPGLPSVLAVMVILITLQMLFGRDSFWLPQWILKRSAPRRRFDKAMRFLFRIAQWIDKLIRPRLVFLTRGVAVRFIGVICLLVAITMPPLEFIPMANTISGATLSLLGLGLIARDGLLILVALGVFGGVVYTLTRVIF